MNVKIKVHENHLIEKKLRHIEDWAVPSSTKNEIKEFVEKAKIGQVQEGKRMSEATISKYLSTLRRTLEFANKPTKQLTKEDIEKVDKKLVALKLKSVANYRVDLKTFLRWKIGEDKARKIAGWLDVKKTKKTPDFLTEQEIDKLFDACKSNGERFLISVLFDLGARIEEFLNIRYEDVQMPDNGSEFIKIALKEEYSKSDGRTVSLYWKESLTSVKKFLDKRIDEGIKSTDPVYNKNYDAVRMFLHRLGKRVLGKDIHPHLFRHSSATYYATRLNRHELCYRYGWKFSSDMPDVYISRAGMQNKELDEKFKSTGLEKMKKEMVKKEFETNKQIEELQKNMVEARKDALDARKENLKLTKGFNEQLDAIRKMIKK